MEPSDPSVASGGLAAKPPASCARNSWSDDTRSRSARVRADSLDVQPPAVGLIRIYTRHTNGGAGGARTHDRRIMRTPAPCNMRSTSTNDTRNRTDGTRRTGITWRPIPRTIPRAHYSGRYAALPCAGREPRYPERLTTAARPTACAHRTGPSAALWPARASARTTAHGTWPRGGPGAGAPGKGL